MAKKLLDGQGENPLLSELISIRRLMIFSLLKSGASQGQIAKALGVHQSQVSRMFPDGITNSNRKVGT
jgi:predicted XRE-type DNA-binding protein